MGDLRSHDLLWILIGDFQLDFAIPRCAEWMDDLPTGHIQGEMYQHLARGANETLRDGKLAPFRNHLAPFGRSR